MRHLVKRHAELVVGAAVFDLEISCAHTHDVRERRRGDQRRQERGMNGPEQRAAHCEMRKSSAALCAFSSRRYTMRAIARTGTDRNDPGIPPSSPPAKTPNITSSGCSSMPSLSNRGERT